MIIVKKIEIKHSNTTPGMYILYPLYYSTLIRCDSIDVYSLLKLHLIK